MKKLLSITLSIIMIMSVVFALPTVSAKQFTSGDYKYKILEDGTASITKYIGYDKKIKDLKIPGKIDGYKVTKVSNYAFGGLKLTDILKLNCIEFPDSIVTIGRFAIDRCSVKLIKLGKNVRNISKSPFAGEHDIIKIVVSKSNKYLVSKNGVLFNKDMTTLLKYPDKKTGSSYKIPKGVKVISNMAFESNEYLKKIVFPGTLKTIEKYAFFSCKKLKSISIPDTVLTIGNLAFSCCEKMTKLSVTPNPKLKINERAFSSSGLTSIVVPKVSGDRVFASCQNLKKITISSKVKTLTSKEFYECPKLKTVTIPKTVTKICKYSLGYIDDGYGSPGKIKGFTIKGKKGSAAYKYAKSNGFKFVSGME